MSGPLRALAMGAGVVFTTSACATASPPPASAAAPDTVVVVDTVRVGGGDQGLEARVASLDLQLLEKEAQILAMEASLEDAMREVVRAMARLQTLASRAEAASAIAEAEVALRELRSRGGRGAVPEVAQAQRLLGLSSTEFDDENFGGALYLANQAKGVAALGRQRLAAVGGAGLRSGEVRFAVPVPLQTTTRSNVREGPSTQFDVVFTVDPSTRVTGQSYAGEWVRITDAAGRTGWIHYQLVRAVR